jgi:hypothetical protein
MTQCMLTEALRRAWRKQKIHLHRERRVTEAILLKELALGEENPMGLLCTNQIANDPISSPVNAFY